MADINPQRAQKIAELRADDYLPIATFQHFEYYTYAAQPNQIRDAERMTAAGAVVVVAVSSGLVVLNSVVAVLMSSSGSALPSALMAR